MKNFLSFLKYNNAIPIAFTIIMLGSASAYAANNPEVIVERKEQVISIDNSYIAEIDLAKYSPTVKILKVEEDTTYYYVTYTLSTIELKEAVWQDVPFEKQLRVEKNGLGPYRDLGLYVTEQLNQVIDSELKRLKETQVIERTQRSQKKIAVAYSGLVGGFLSGKVETVKGYKPVIVPPKPEVEKQTFARPDPNAFKQKPKPPVEEPAPMPAEQVIEEDIPEDVDAEEQVPLEEVPETGIPNAAPEVTLLGASVIRIPLGSAYVDLGATVIDDHDPDIILELFLNDVAVESIILDTSVVATNTITYFAEDSGGKSAGAVRTVVVYDPNPPIADEEISPEEEEESATSSEPVVEEPAPDSPQAETSQPTIEDPAVTEDQTSSPPADVSEAVEPNVPEPIPSET